MSDDHRRRSGAVYSCLWDGKPATRTRADGGTPIIIGRRFSMHIMMQPDVANMLLSNAELRDQGFLSRLLVSSSPSLAGTV
jgi:Protein of unknown function (DUF3987)